jgi:hypothetical protein
MGFPASLQALSVAQGVRASVMRTPAKPAIIAGDATIDYAALGAAIDGEQPAAGPSWLPGLLAALRASRLPARSDADEGAVFAPFSASSHRELVLGLFDLAVAHAAFSRDTVSAMPLVPGDASFELAVLAPLWLGGTLVCPPPGEAGAFAQAIESGSVNQAWMSATQWNDPVFARAMPPAPPGFRLLVCDGMPPLAVVNRLRDWLGTARVTAQTPGRRHPGLDEAGETMPALA